MLEKLEIDKALLPKVYESPEITGVISEEAAKRTGLLAGTIVVGGAGDNAAAAVGTGVVEDGKAFTTIGTSGVDFAHTDKLPDVYKRQVLGFQARHDGFKRLPEGLAVRAGAVVFHHGRRAAPHRVDQRPGVVAERDQLRGEALEIALRKDVVVHRQQRAVQVE